MQQVAPGDVLAVQTGQSIGARLIRFGERLRGLPDHDDHIVIVHHQDPTGVWWGIEGRPGGVGWVDVARYGNRWLLTNADQAKTAKQRAQVCQLAETLLGTPYDWTAIAADAMHALGIETSLPDFGADPPTHVVCSSLASWEYRRAGLAEPHMAARWVWPGDWARFMQQRAWAAAS